MRTLIARMLALLMLMPLLACAMPECPTAGYLVSATAQDEVVSHCPDATPSAGHEQAAAVMLFADCMGVDLQAHFTPLQLLEPTFSPDLDLYPLIGCLAVQGASDTLAQSIRGSPAILGALPTTAPVYFQTQRFRL